MLRIGDLYAGDSGLRNAGKYKEKFSYINNTYLCKHESCYKWK